MAKKTGTLGDIKNATVFIDANGDGIQGANEISANADANGKFVLTGKSAQLKGTLIATGGEDKVTGAANTTVYTAPASAKVVNAFTSLIAEVGSEQGISAAKAAKAVATALGLGKVSTSTLLNSNPEQLLAAAGKNAIKLEKAIDLVEAAKQVSTLLDLGTAVLKGAAPSATTATLQSGLLGALAGSIAKGEPLDFTSATQISGLLGTAAGNAGLTTQEVAKINILAADAAKVVAASLDKIADAVADAQNGKQTKLADITAALQTVENVQKVAENLTKVLETAATSGSLSSVVENYTGTALDNVVKDPSTVPTTPVTPTEPVSDGGGGDGSSATFTVTNTSDVITFGGTATGNITVAIDDSHTATFSRGGITATTTVANIGNTDIQTTSSQPLVISAAQIKAHELSVTNAGPVTITGLADTLDVDLSSIGGSGETTAVFDTSGIFTGNLGVTKVTVSTEVTLTIDSEATMDTATFSVSSGATLEGTAAKLTGKTVTGAGTTVVTELAANTDLTNITPTTLNATVTSSISLGAVDLSNVDHLTVGADGGSVVNVTVSSAQLAALAGKTTIGSDDSLAADTTQPTAAVTTANVTVGESVTTAQSSETGTVYLVPSTTDLTDITVTALEALVTEGMAKKATVTAANTNTTIATTGLAEGTYKTISVDAAGNIAAALSTNAITLGDFMAPTASVVTATIQPAGNAVVQSTETGTAYLVKSTVAVSAVDDITSAADNNVNSVSITAAATNTNLAATGLADGTYKVYAVDAAGNLSAASSDSVTIDGTAPAKHGTRPVTAMNADHLDTTYAADDVITIKFAEPVKVTSLALTDLVLSEGHSFGAAAVLAGVGAEGGFTDTFTVTLAGADITVAAADTITIAAAKVEDVAGNVAAGDVVLTVPALAAWTAGTAGQDTLTGSANSDVIFGDADADDLSGGTNNAGAFDTFVQGLTDSVTNTAQSFAVTNKVTAGDTLTFGSGVDVIKGFDAGEGGDLFDAVGASGGLNSVVGTPYGTTWAFLAGALYFASGDYDSASGVFTFNADGAGTDTLIIQGGGDTFDGNQSMVILVGVDSDNLVASNFV